MEAHFAKLSILAIVLLIAILSVPESLAGYSTEDSARLSLRKRLCPNGLTPISYHHMGVGGASTIVVRCVRGRNVVQVGARFNTWDRDSRFGIYDRFRKPIGSHKRYG
ncbi:MAG: hypothetical protein ACE5FT_01700 [Candidatus Nanoarchaeia archaeon]